MREIVSLALLWAGAPRAQTAETLRLIGPGGVGEATASAKGHRGYAAVLPPPLARLGWAVSVTAPGGQARRGSDRIRVRTGSPFFDSSGELLQLTYEAGGTGDRLWVPLQLPSDFLPAHLPDDYAFEPVPLVLRSLVGRRWTAGASDPANQEPGEAPPAPAPATELGGGAR